MRSKRLKLRLHILALVFLVAAWLLSYRWGIGLEVGASRPRSAEPGRLIALALGGGRISLEHQSGSWRSAFAMNSWEPSQATPAFIQFRHRDYPGVPRFGLYARYTNYRFIGFQYFRVTGQEYYPEGRALVIPIWFLVALASIHPIARLARWLTHRRAEYRASQGLCIRCGYDLRASQDRCPECGAAIESAPAHSAPAPR